MGYRAEYLCHASNHRSGVFATYMLCALQTEAWRVLVCALSPCLYFCLCVAVRSVSFGLYQKKGD